MIESTFLGFVLLRIIIPMAIIGFCVWFSDRMNGSDGDGNAYGLLIGLFICFLTVWRWW